VPSAARLYWLSTISTNGSDLNQLSIVKFLADAYLLVFNSVIYWRGFASFLTLLPYVGSSLCYVIVCITNYYVFEMISYSEAMYALNGQLL
jgi:hypothetical protein